MNAPGFQPVASGVNAQLTEADNTFFLGLYRHAISFYQPKIEKRTGVRLGTIIVRDYRQFDQDVLQNVERIRYPWLYRLFKRSAIKANLKEWREHLESTHMERAHAGMATYYRSTVYVSFSHEIRCHEEGIAFTAVHELCHALWERLEGKPLHLPRAGATVDREKFALLVEGYATYAEQIWFLDTYPECVRKIVPHAQLEQGSVHYRGMRIIQGLVKQFGEQILLEIPKRWRNLEISVP